MRGDTMKELCSHCGCVFTRNGFRLLSTAAWGRSLSALQAWGDDGTACFELAALHMPVLLRGSCLLLQWFVAGHKPAAGMSLAEGMRNGLSSLLKACGWWHLLLCCFLFGKWVICEWTDDTVRREWDPQSHREVRHETEQRVLWWEWGAGRESAWWDLTWMGTVAGQDRQRGSCRCLLSQQHLAAHLLPYAQGEGG